MKQINTHSVVAGYGLGKPITDQKYLSDKMDYVFGYVMKNTQPESVKNMFCVAYVSLINVAPQSGLR